MARRHRSSQVKREREQKKRERQRRKAEKATQKRERRFGPKDGDEEGPDDQQGVAPDLPTEGTAPPQEP